MSSNALATVQLSDMQIMADAIALSGLFGMKNGNQALALMLVAQSENQHPATITQDYDIISGKACRKTHSVMARFQQMGGKVEWHELTDQIADATFSHPSGCSLRISWTIDQAKKANLAGKDSWKNYPRAMLRARCIAEGVRAVYPAAIGGMLVAEEAKDMDEPARDASARQGEPRERVVEGEIILPDYPADSFASNILTWAKFIAAGKKTPEAIIAQVGSKAALSDDQKAAIRELPLYNELVAAMQSANGVEELDEAVDRACAVITDPTLQGELGNIDDARRNELAGA